MVATPLVERSFDNQADFDWAKVAGANFGLAIHAKQTPEYLPEGVHAMAALASDGGNNNNTEARELVVSDDLSTNSLINNKLKSVAAENIDYKSLVAEAGRPEEEIIVLAAEKDRMESVDLKAEDNRLEDKIGDEGILDRVTLDKIGPNLYFRLTKQVLKEAATKEEESEWAKLVETAVDTAKDIASKLPTLPGLGGSRRPRP
ncbi:hypothetical protein N8T08_003335 [Aspergillus melleus]|uniref:Uncharacterized protein n=1 Tax=Aspergillus melleus TaxID=138277 RepID=A0ACC3B710_9EURO|nr:hypothetical protein N8T08_003335 [Aspergillus melleus]